MLHAPHTAWNMSHRLRFVALANSEEGSLSVLPPAVKNGRVQEAHMQKLADMNIAYMDVGLTRASQCEPDNICDGIRQIYTMKNLVWGAQSKRFKYIMDVRVTLLVLLWLMSVRSIGNLCLTVL